MPSSRSGLARSVVHALERDDGRPQRAARADAAAEPEQRQWLIDGPGHASPLGPAHPVRDLDGLEADVVEAVLAHAARGPRRSRRVSAAEPVMRAP